MSADKSVQTWILSLGLIVVSKKSSKVNDGPRKNGALGGATNYRSINSRHL